jgi:hypothetical protein
MIGLVRMEYLGHSSSTSTIRQSRLAFPTLFQDQAPRETFDRSAICFLYATMTNALSVTELAIYIALAFPTVYLIIKHGRQGLLGWLFLFIFCTLRIIGGALAINSSSPTANIISSVGLSPLLLATSGILHEA